MTQNEMILTHLRDFGSITPVEAMKEYGCMRLGARIYNLKREGHDIRTERETHKNRYGKSVTYARYVMPRVNTPESRANGL